MKGVIFMSCKNKKNKKQNMNSQQKNLLEQTVRQEAATPAHIQDNNKKSM